MSDSTRSSGILAIHVRTIGNLLANYWMGADSLLRSFLLGCVAISGVVWVLAYTAIEISLLDRISDNVFACYLAVAGFVIALVVSVWQVVGLWRSTDRLARTTDSWFWSVFAKALRLSWAIFAAVQMGASAINLYLTSQILLSWGHYEMDVYERTDLCARCAEFQGAIGGNSAKRLFDYLKAHPDTRVLILTSPGGRAVDGFRMQTIVRQNQLVTFVTQECSSTCTTVYLGGRIRGKLPNARLGFHAISPGQLLIVPPYTRNLVRRQEMDLRNNGASPEFIRMALSQLPPQLWYPDDQLLIDSHVVNVVGLIADTWPNAN